jgi:hypothetical protein
MQQHYPRNRQKLLKSALVLALLSFLAFAGTGRPLTLDDLIFFASFDKDLQPERPPVLDPFFQHP